MVAGACPQCGQSQSFDFNALHEEVAKDAAKRTKITSHRMV